MGEADGRAPFDPSDPFDAMAEMFRTQITDLVLKAYSITIFRDLSAQRQIECVVAGVLTGLVGCSFASIRPEGRDAMMDYIAECLPTARMFAESIRNPDDGTPALTPAHG